MIKRMLAIWALMLIPSISFAANVQPVSYDMINGGTGNYYYWDDKYTGTGSKTTDYAPLSGGLGDLTDGVIATDHWINTESRTAPGPYVGWQNRNPVITFHFASQTNFQSVGIYFDDANGLGGVNTPAGVTINGKYFAVTDPDANVPFLALFDIGDLDDTDTLTIEITRAIRNGINDWVFVSEVVFTDTSAGPVPEPATMLLLGLGLAGVAVARKRFQK